MTNIETQVATLTERVDHGFAAHASALRDHTEQLANLAATHPTSRITDLEKATNELSILVNQAVVRLTATDNGLSESRTYLHQKIAEHQTQLSELFGASPSKITDRLNGLAGHIARLDAVNETLHERLDELEATTKEHAGFISDDRGKHNDHRNDPDAHKP